MNDERQVILYADDSEDDVLLMHRVLEDVGFTGELQVLPHGLDVIDYLSGSGHYADRTLYPLPNLVLLDIKMPRVDGLEVLKWIRRDEALRTTPVLMLSASRQACDVAEAYAAKADAYLVKPVEMTAFRALVTAVTTLCGRSAGTIDPLVIPGSVPAPSRD